MVHNLSLDNVHRKFSNNKYLNYVGFHCHDYKSSSYPMSNEGTSSEGVHLGSLSGSFISILMLGFFFSLT